MSISDIKSKARRAIHRVHGEPCTYTAPGGAAIPSAEQIADGLTLTARFATKLKTFTPESDAMMILEGVERVIFNQEQLDALGLTPENAAVLDFPGFGITLHLDQEMDIDGPIDRPWTVTRV
jgi:hypothetical protein